VEELTNSGQLRKLFGNRRIPFRCCDLVVVILNVAGSSPVTHPNGSGHVLPSGFHFLTDLATLMQR
jgi:hypothetical protein